jgi:predicted lipoprotein with Yx(FWY)xxD motif
MWLGISSLTVATLLAGCGGVSQAVHSSATTTRLPKSTGVPVTAVPTTSPPAAVPPFYEVTTASVAGLGTVLVNGDGFTLYMFEPDRQSGRSTCYGECENLWPPVVLVDGIKAPLAGAGVEASLLGVTTVPTGGLEQITYNGWPLYLWHGDSQPGEATGQGLNNSGGLWYVLDPEGDPIVASP